MILFVKLAAGLAALYLIVVVLIALAQDWLLFPRSAMGNGKALSPPLPNGSWLRCPLRKGL
jgi:hypothetical protein